METDLASVIDGHAERFVPEVMGGQIVEAEHVSRYWWAASLVSEKRVLDAGCGTAYGSAIMAHAGALEVVGVDLAHHVLDAVRPRMPSRVALEVADVGDLPFDDHSFDVVVCFEVIEHVEDTERVLAELARVLASNGVLAISSPNRDVYVSGNPHHRYEFVPDELDEALKRHFEHVRLFRQGDWITAAVLDDDTHAFEGDEPLTAVEFRKAVAGRPGDELYTIALAGEAPLPEPVASAMLTRAAEIKGLVETSERLTEQSENLIEQNERLTEESQRLTEQSENLIEQNERLTEESQRLTEQSENLIEQNGRLTEESQRLTKHVHEVEQEQCNLVRRTAQTESKAAEASREAAALETRLHEVELEWARAHQIIARHPDELDAANDRIRAVEEANAAVYAKYTDAHRVIREMQETRVWRIGAWYWRLRDRILRRRPTR